MKILGREKELGSAKLRNDAQGCFCRVISNCVQSGPIFKEKKKCQKGREGVAHIYCRRMSEDVTSKGVAKIGQLEVGGELIFLLGGQNR